MACFDPCQLFKVKRKPCMLFHVRIIEGRRITKGSESNLWLPDSASYVSLRVKTAPDKNRKTRAKPSDTNPTWQDCFTFLLDEKKENILEIALTNADDTIDETLDRIKFSIKELTLDQPEIKTFVLDKILEIDVELKTEMSNNRVLRCSQCLSDEEKLFLIKRREKILQALQELLGNRGPTDESQVPTIGVLGSGGGFRAMTGMSGVFKALADSKLLDCVTYVATLSGSSWYLSTLYSHTAWPKKNPGDFVEELKTSVDSGVLRLLTLDNVYRFFYKIFQKRKRGQPISFTDFFGHLIGETLIKDRIDVKLSDQQKPVQDGDVPLPLYASVVVKDGVSAKSFQEWVEFSPYEIGMQKYGTYIKSDLFGSKFYMGHVCKRFEEPPLHFLQGIWGSAFCVLFKRLFKRKSVHNNNHQLKQESMNRRNSADITSSYDKAQSISGLDEPDAIPSNEKSCDETDYRNCAVDSPFLLLSQSVYGAQNEEDHIEREMVFDLNEDESDDEIENEDPFIENESLFSPQETDLSMDTLDGFFSFFRNLFGKSESKNGVQLRNKGSSFWMRLLERIGSHIPLLNTRFGRAGVVHNPIRALSLNEAYDQSEPEQLTGETFRHFEAFSKSLKRLFMVDAGLAMNLPYPLLLRKQRQVDIYISFDFTYRESDNAYPFQELLTAEKWAKEYDIPFPPIDVSDFQPDNLREMYVFRHPTDLTCPVVIHFVLANVDFRKYKKPGIPRETDEERDFADFSIFDDPRNPYSTLNFCYTHQDFDRLSQLMEFNTLSSLEQIKDIIADCIQRKQLASSNDMKSEV